MKVLYDSQAFDMQTHGGVSRCFAELYSHLPQDIEASPASWNLPMFTSKH